MLVNIMKHHDIFYVFLYTVLTLADSEMTSFKKLVATVKY